MIRDVSRRDAVLRTDASAATPTRHTSLPRFLSPRIAQCLPLRRLRSPSRSRRTKLPSLRAIFTATPSSQPSSCPTFGGGGKSLLLALSAACSRARARTPTPLPLTHALSDARARCRCGMYPRSRSLTLALALGQPTSNASSTSTSPAHSTSPARSSDPGSPSRSPWAAPLRPSTSPRSGATKPSIWGNRSCSCRPSRGWWR